MEFRIAAERSPNAIALSANDPHRLDDADGVLRFAGFEFDLRRAELHAPDGTPVALRPKTEALLRRFLASPGRLLAKDALMTALWPTAVVTDDSLVQCVGDLRLALGDAGQKLIRTVPRRGYRLDAEVERLTGADSAPGSLAADHLALPTKRRAERAVWPWVGAIAVAAVAAAVAAVLLSRPSAPRVRIDEAIAARATVAVMPFVAARDDAELRRIADAAADAIAAQLATRIGMRGIGRAATGAFDGRPDAPARLASELKATHVVTGRVTHAGADPNRYAIDVQLATLGSGEVEWAQHFERPGGATVAIDLDVIGQHVVNAMRNRAVKPDKVGTAQQEQSTDPVDLTLGGWNDFDRRSSVEDVRRARGKFEAALRADPQSVIALNGVAATYGFEHRDPAHRLNAAQWAEFERTIERVRQLVPEDATALLGWGSLQLMRGHAELALPAFEKAIRLVPSYPMGHIYRAQALMLLGRADEIQAEIDQAVEVGHGDPRRISLAYQLAAEAALMLGANDRGEDLARRSIAQQPSNGQAHAALAAADALSGRDDQARVELAAFLKLWPGATIARYDELNPSSNPVWVAQRQRLYDGLRKAGLPAR